MRIGSPGGYLFDALMLLFLFVAYLGDRDLQAFSKGLPSVTVPGSTFVFYGTLGIYGIRAAMYVAMLRRNRAPQTIEWLVFIFPIAFAIVCFVASGPLLRVYADLHGYRFCSAHGDRATMYTFARQKESCPAASRAGE
ncbi:hypothetical protein HN018_22145 (plasmid) [Lichenicola cladoniae]|uniref:Uncharacterized protein n=1 Tax=Lichenicola cladoniae TaxID=1484109 RepID=A0A6M8HX23_9PROT|nr:hypothetical protein [Lichenicola cladoniae]NPD69848.1 hypothetical protein [Acetobacteraceae bacterium]QKE92928.1 hypothetical protein HN018_22145 [Lichenicola cladoniae]